MATAKSKPRTKTVLYKALSDKTGLDKNQVENFLAALGEEIAADIGNTDPGAFVIPGLIKIERKIVPAREAKKGVPNPFKPGETMDVDARPESCKVKVKALKGLKDMVS